MTNFGLMFFPVLETSIFTSSQHVKQYQESNLAYNLEQAFSPQTRDLDSYNCRLRYRINSESYISRAFFQVLLLLIFFSEEQHGYMVSLIIINKSWSTASNFFFINLCKTVSKSLTAVLDFKEFGRRGESIIANVLLKAGISLLNFREAF